MGEPSSLPSPRVKTAIIIPPTMAALAVCEPHGGEEREPRRQPTMLNAVSPLRDLHEKAQAAELAQQEARREQLRKLRAKAKKVRQRMAATAASVRVEQLDQLWSGGSSVQGNKRMLRLIGDLSQLASQPQSDGAEATVVELCRLLESGRERDLHAVRSHGGVEHLLTLALAGTDGGGTLVAPPRRTTQTAALRALLAACALPRNRTYLLLRNHADRLAFQLLPAAVAGARPPRAASPRAPTCLAAGGRAAAAAAQAAAADHRDHAAARGRPEAALDLVVALRFSGGLEELQLYAAACSSTLARRPSTRPS